MVSICRALDRGILQPEICKSHWPVHASFRPTWSTSTDGRIWWIVIHHIVFLGTTLTSVSCARVMLHIINLSIRISKAVFLKHHFSCLWPHISWMCDSKRRPQLLRQTVFVVPAVFGATFPVRASISSIYLQTWSVTSPLAVCFFVLLLFANRDTAVQDA